MGVIKWQTIHLVLNSEAIEEGCKPGRKARLESVVVRKIVTEGVCLAKYPRPTERLCC
jgi:hypothetical protein